MMEYGSDPWIEIDENYYLFQEIDASVCIEIDLLPDRMIQSWIQCWFVMIGYGARPKGRDSYCSN